MSRIFITGSTDGLGLAAARCSAVRCGQSCIVIGDLSSAARTRAVAEQVNELGRMNAIIHNAGIYLERSRGSIPRGTRPLSPPRRAAHIGITAKQQSPAPEAKDLAFQNQLLARLAELTGVLMP